MRLLCVGRHEYLSEHLCRFFSAPDVQCEPVVGGQAAVRGAVEFEPHLVVAESDLLTPSVLAAWMSEDALRDVPVMAVSLTHRPGECVTPDGTGVNGVLYLPALDRADALALVIGARRPRGVDAPRHADVSIPQPAAAAH
ncbi:MAG: hypothetical protein ABJA80_02830 [bacterium]